MSEEPQTGEPSGDGQASDEQRAPLPSWSRSRTKKRSTGGGEEPDAFQRGVTQAGKAAVSRTKTVVGLVAVGLAGLSAFVYAKETAGESTAEQTRELSALAALESRGQVGEAP